MNRAKVVAAVVFAMSTVTGTLLDRAFPPRGGGSPAILVADLHVHPYPGDGGLPTWELQREARRRGLDVLAVTGHNNRLGLALGRVRRLDPGGPIVLPGQEVTAPSFHMIAVGIERLVDWRLTARDAIAAIHEQGGVAIAAHPDRVSWRVDDPDALRALDAAEVAHPSLEPFSQEPSEFARFFNRARGVNPQLSPVGSSDFHMTAPLGLCRTYLLVEERSAAGVLEALRQGRTVAADPRGRLVGAAEHVRQVEAFLASAPPPEPATPVDRGLAVTALLALAVMATPTGERGRGRGQAPS